MSLLTIIYWVLWVLAVIGAFAPAEWAYPRVNAVVILILFGILGYKLLKPNL